MTVSKSGDTPKHGAEQAELKGQEGKTKAPIVLTPDQIESVAAGTAPQAGSHGTTTGMKPEPKLTKS